MSDLPLYIPIVFIGTVFLAIILFLKAVPSQSKVIPSVLLAWLFFTGVMAYKGFFQETASFPPSFVLAVAPPVILIVILFFSKSGRRFINGLDLKTLTLLSIVRIPVELVLYWLSVQKLVPGLMTFTGRNFDIIAGITAPIMYFACFKGHAVTNKKLLLFWNLVSLLLLINIIINAVLSAPFPFQQFAFDQPNVAVLQFPYIWLPSCIVMLVLLSHLASIKKLLKSY